MIPVTIASFDLPSRCQGSSQLVNLQNVDTLATVKRLIVNADDFGLTQGVNRAIVEGHHTGIITSSTLMANSGQFQEAVDLARQQPRLGIGCHLMLVDGAPLSPPEQVGSLLNGNKTDAAFPIGFGVLARRVMQRRVSTEEIRREALAQIDRIRNAGIAPTHFDTHKHTHMLPRVLEPLLEAASERGLRALRNPFEPAWAVGRWSFLGMPGKCIRPLEVSLLRRMLPGFKRLAEKFGMRYPEGTIGIAITGTTSKEKFLNLLRELPEGTWELVCHPGYNDPELDTIRTRLRASREQELSWLVSEEARALIEKQGIELISFREL